MEVSKALRFAYYDALSAQISVPIFDVFALPEDTPYPYILLSTQTSVQMGIKRCKAYDATMLIDIVTGGPGVASGRIQAEDLAEQIEDIVNPDTLVDLDLRANGYAIGFTTREMDTDLSSMNGTVNIYRKLIRYKHLISKL